MGFRMRCIFSRTAVRRGFTLIELLVCVAVLALLAALLFPVFVKARERSRQAACAGNLRQIGQASALYVQDNEGRLFSEPASALRPPPPGPLPFSSVIGVCWIAQPLAPYVRGARIYQCPTDPHWGTQWRDAYTGGEPVSYAYNFRGIGLGTPLTQIPEPATALMLWDSGVSSSVNCPFEDAACGWRARDWKMSRLHDAELTGWHGGRCNFLYADGHVRAADWAGLQWQSLAPRLTPGAPSYGVSVAVPNPVPGF